MQEIKIAFLGIGALAIKDRSPPITDLPGKIYRRTVGAWSIELCGDNYQANITFNGWPAGVISPRSGIIAAGSAANEDAFIAAIEEELGSGIEAFLSSQEPSDASN